MRHHPHPTLTSREKQMLVMLAAGMTSTRMAGWLYLSHHTVRSHIRTLLKKLGARTRAHAVHIAHRDGLIR